MTEKNDIYLPTIEFYDLIAEDYNYLLNQDQEDIKIRNFIKDIFLKTVKPGTVIDFGGGTGLDLPWLCENNFKIYFFEPSEKMRFHARKLNDVKLKSDKIIFLDNPDTDFHLWTEKHPFPEKATAILMNFSVLNCIHDIDELFLAISKIINRDGYIFITALDTTLFGRVNYFYNKLYLAVKGHNVEASTPSYQNKKHFIFRHTLKKIKSSAANYFSAKDVIPMRQRGLMLVQLQRNSND